MYANIYTNKSARLNNYTLKSIIEIIFWPIKLIFHAPIRIYIYAEISVFCYLKYTIYQKIRTIAQSHIWGEIRDFLFEIQFLAIHAIANLNLHYYALLPNCAIYYSHSLNIK